MSLTSTHSLPLPLHVANTRLIVQLIFHKCSNHTIEGVIAPVEIEASETKPVNDRQVPGIDHWHITNSFIHASGVQFNAPDQTWGQSTPGIEKLAMDQIANNQNYLNNLNVQQGSYTGPRLHLHRTKHKVSSRQQVFSETKLQISVVIYLM